MPFILSCDYDGTLFSGSYPEKGEPKQDVIDKVKEFKNTGLCEIILWTCREDKSLEEALIRCKEVGLEFDAVNENAPSQLKYMEEKKKEGEIFATRKIFANFYLDDRSYNIDFFLKIDAKSTCERFNNY
jgi:hypothetical protein